MRQELYPLAADMMYPLIGDQSVQLVWTDPPFGTGKRQTLNSTRKSYQDGTTVDTVALCVELATESLRFLTPTGVVCICLDYRSVHHVAVEVGKTLEPRGEIVWHFETGGLAKKWWANKHNTILMFGLPGAQSTFDFSRIPQVPRKASKPGYDATKPINSVWNINVSTTDPERSGYPNQKPLELVSNFIAVHTEPGDLVIDPFAGSGTTGVAAQAMDRGFICSDNNPEAFSIAKGRLGL